MNYPTWIEPFWLRKAQELWGVTDVGELAEQARPHAARLSDLFTADRPRVMPDYATDPALRVAYGLFFFPQTFARTLWILDECFNAAGYRLPAREHSFRLLDFGAGSGAAAFAALTFLSAFRWHWTAVDASAAHLEDLRALAETGRSCLPEFTLEVRAADFSTSTARDGAPWDVILMSFALNELSAQNDARAHELLWCLLDDLAPGGLLVVCEPASQSASECLEAFRDAVSDKRRASILAPCLHAQPCPLLAGRLFWCHEVRPWTPPPAAERINRQLYRDLSRLKFSFVAVANQPPARMRDVATAARARLVAPVVAERGKLVTRGCAEDGRVYTYELLTRHLSSDSRAAALRLERGARVRFEGIQPLRDDVVRARGIVALPEKSPSRGL
jgi:ribosomal protein RSM22 (predicted rRNA methylase)